MYCCVCSGLGLCVKYLSALLLLVAFWQFDLSAGVPHVGCLSCGLVQNRRPARAPGTLCIFSDVRSPKIEKPWKNKLEQLSNSATLTQNPTISKLSAVSAKQNSSDCCAVLLHFTDIILWTRFFAGLRTLNLGLEFFIHGRAASVASREALRLQI